MALDLEEWQKGASKMLKAELLDNDCSYKELSRKLERIGVKYDYRALANRINRGTFSAAFLLQCLVALGVRRLDVPEALIYHFKEQQ
ncbi:DUF6471 domain-containing protein [Thiohalobacter thiocyanaticus]|uniref:DUF6471 domain-containing protein n=1 Tax=Thiohalobacter thiocyanaticus TaxID=585455 RepID=A0A426QN56_9GAMM|nr:DUF6471 domain-containing protein [Thiohalobacter thiocyanaticus]RRQ23106.1 hypothetical protein D6C00_10010 [Thiohalobacter thiocyanaticus]